MMSFKNGFSQRFGNCAIAAHRMMTPKIREKRRIKYWEIFMEKKENVTEKFRDNLSVLAC